MTYIYDAKGVIGMAYRNDDMASGEFEYYLFEKNLQGDIVAVYTASGIKLVSYTYDAWGNVSSLYHNNGASTAARYNSFRYRGYFYDEETKLYYLNSRYYDPATGRFINADVIIPGTSGELNGYNLYAYCFNNPVNMTDSDGNWPEWIDNIIIWVDENIVEPIKEFVEDVFEDIDNYDKNNESEEKVFESNYFSNYKGALVIKTPFDASFSFGFIGLSKLQQNPGTLRHEYGHTIQMQNMGAGKYIKDVAIPSVMINILARKDKLPYDYYSFPWEAEANKLGESTLSDDKPPLPKGGYNSYWDLIKLFFE